MNSASPSSHEVTHLLAAWKDGDQAALEQLAPLVHNELRRLARGYMRRERQGHLLQTSALINEAYVRLIDWQNADWQNRAHFFAVAAQFMRRILVDFARRNPRQAVVSLAEDIAAGAPDTDLVKLDEALESLAALDPRKARIVELRFFGGLSVEETAEVMQLSGVTVMREWGKAKAWLFQEIRGG
jgi:RNA polymerase sigma factor (TIGR02999 family)